MNNCHYKMKTGIFLLP